MICSVYVLYITEKLSYLCIWRYDDFFKTVDVVARTHTYGVATISRLLKIIGLFCKRALWKRLYSAKETCNFKEPTNRSHPICTHILRTDQNDRDARVSTFAHMHTLCTHIHTLMYTLTHPRTYTHIVTHLHVYTHKDTHTHTHTYTRTHTHISTHSHTRTHARSPYQSQGDRQQTVCRGVCIYMCVCACVHVHKYIYIYIYIYLYIYILYIYILYMNIVFIYEKCINTKIYVCICIHVYICTYHAYIYI